MSSDPWRRVAAVELRWQLRRPAALLGSIIIAILISQPLGYTGPGGKGLVTFGAVAHDSPLLVGVLFGRVTLVGLFFAALIFGSAGRRDMDDGWRSIASATPVGAGSIVAGRFLGALGACVAMFTPGLLLGAFALGGLEPEYLAGANAAGSLSTAMVVVVLPTLAAAGAVFLGLAVVGGIGPVFVVLVGMIALHPLTATLALGPLSAGYFALLDPTGVAPLLEAGKYWSVFERSVAPLPVGLAFIANRLLWISGGVIALAAAVRGYRDTVDPSRSGILSARQPAGPARFRWRHRSAGSTRLTALLRLEGGRVLAHPATPVLAALASVQVLRNLQTATATDGTGSLPVTAMLIGAATNVDEFVLGLTILFAGLLMWRDQANGSATLVEATPIPAWLVVVSRIVALFSGQAAILGLATLLVIGYQLAHGGTPDIVAAVAVLALVELPRYLHWAIVGILASSLAPGRTSGFLFAGIAILLLDAVLPALGITSPLLLYGSVPEVRLSPMNGLHPFIPSIVALRLYWLVLSLPLVLLVARLWRRGVATSLLRRIRHGNSGLHARGLRIVGGAALAAVTAGMALGVAEHASAGTRLDPAEFRAEFERRYRPLREDPQPQLAAVDLLVAFHPGARKARVTASYTLVNRGARPVERLDAFLFPILYTELLAVEADRPIRQLPPDEEIGYRPYAFSSPLAPGDSVRVDFEIRIDAPVLAAGRGNPDLVGNGSYIDNFLPGRYFPAIGYQPTVEIDDPALRRAHDLPRRALPDPASGHAREESVSPSKVRYSATVSTVADQRIIAPGDRLQERVSGGRRIATFAADDMRASFAFVSGRYDVVTRWDGPVAVEVYHHPGHDANLDPIFEGAFASLRYNHRFAPYPFNILRVVEVPDYGHIGGTARAMPSMIAWNETGGWLDDYGHSEAFPFALATAAHEVAHQWWPGMVAPALAAGYGVVGEGLPDQSRIRVLDELLGRAGLVHWMRRSRHGYFRDRGAVTEEPLMSARHPFEFRNKSQFALRWSAWAGGEEAVDRAIANLATPPGAPEIFVTTLDLRRSLAVELPATLGSELRNWFDRITVWDMEVKEVSYRAGAAGDTVEVRVLGTRYVVDGRGAVLEEIEPGLVEIAVLDVAGTEIARSRQHLPTGESIVRMAVTRTPARVIIDPDERLLDPVQEDDEAPVGPRLTTSLHRDHPGRDRRSAAP